MQCLCYLYPVKRVETSSLANLFSLICLKYKSFCRIFSCWIIKQDKKIINREQTSDLLTLHFFAKTCWNIYVWKLGVVAPKRIWQHFFIILNKDLLVSLKKLINKYFSRTFLQLFKTWTGLPVLILWRNSLPSKTASFLLKKRRIEFSTPHCVKISQSEKRLPVFFTYICTIKGDFSGYF